MIAREPELSQTVVGRRYVLQTPLGQGGMGIVFQAQDRLDDKLVALKMVTAPANRLLFASMTDDANLNFALAQEFKVLASLRHPNIIGVLDYGFDQKHQPFFTMDLLSKPQTVIYAGKGQDTAGKVALLIQILQALIYLHRRGILHRDLKPNNILVTDGQLKVLDFGLSVSASQATQSNTTIGTLAYMAPELLVGEKPSLSSDLYAVGIIAYELFVGRHPFAVEKFNELIKQITETAPDMTPLEDNPELVSVLNRLLAKDPYERYIRAEEVIAALCAATAVPVPGESLAIRESFIQSAAFVDREQEFEALSDSFATSLDGKGSVVLLGGESGVGKSRLLDELRIRALVQGVPVLRGQCVSEGGIPYQVWRPILRNMILFEDIAPAQAGILKAIIPDIAALLGEDVPEVPELEPQASRDRLLSVIETLLLEQKLPVIFLLEDMHWAGTESLSLLQRLSTILSRTPILIIGSYRDDEAPDLPNRIPVARSIRLKRLPEQYVGELSESILGEAGQRREVVQFLQRETEGNAFFLVEVVRLLAEEAGQLDKIGQITLSEEAFGGGLKQIVQRRLSRLPDSDRKVLLLAAIIGRELDLDALRALAPDVDIDRWLLDCANLSLLEAQGSQWRFAHDKFRETMVESVTPAENRTLNQRVAEAIEKIHPGDPNHVAALAYHFEQADVKDKAVIYLEKAGEQALNASVYQRAIELFTRAIAMEPGKSGSPESVRYARRSRYLGDAYYNLGLLKEANQHLEDSLEYLGFPFPDRTMQVGIALAGHGIRQFAHRRWPSRFQGRSAQVPYLLDAMEAVRLLTGVHFIDGDLVRWLYVTLLWLNFAEKGKLTPEVNQALSFVYAIMSTVTGTIPYPLHGAARQYQRMALKNMEDAPESIQAVVYNYVGIYTLGVGDWQMTEDVLKPSRAIYQEMGHPRRWEELSIFEAFLNYYRGNFDRAYQLWSEHYPSSLRRNDTQMQYPSLIGRIQCLLRTKAADQLDEAVGYVRDIDKFFFEPARQANTNNAERANYYALLAALYLRQGRYQDAWEAGDKTLHFTKKLFSEVKVLVHEPYDRLPELYLTLWDLTRKPGNETILTEAQRARLPALAQESVKLLKAYSRVITFTRPRALLWEGWAAALSGNVEQAVKLWQQSIELAQKFNLPYDQGRAHYAIAHHLPKGDGRRQASLAAVRDLFQKQNIQDSLVSTAQLV